MHTKQLFAALAASLFATAGFTAPVTSDVTGNFFEFNTAGSTLTRAEVIAQARQVAPRSIVHDYDVVAPAASGVTRDEVLADLKRARADGSLAQKEWFEAAEPVPADAATVIVHSSKSQGNLH